MTRPVRRLAILLAALLPPAFLPAPSATAAQDLAKLYPGALKWSETGLFPTCTAADVWKLRKFEVVRGKEFRVSAGPSTAAFGVHEGNVLWAAVFPDEPAEIRANAVGNGEKAKTIFLRFPPAELNQVFPPATVIDRGDPWLRAHALRIAARKVCWKWCTPAGFPTVVPAGWRLVDMDTVGGPRRFYGVDGSGGRVEYVAEFENSPVPASPPIAKAAARAALDEVWKAFDAEYAGFVLLPKLDWGKAGEDARRRIERAETVFDAAAVISEMLCALQDRHVWVRAGEEGVPGFAQPREPNASWDAIGRMVGPLRTAGEDLQWGRTGAIGYLAVNALSDPKLPDEFDTALESLKDTKGLIVDLRFNGGGDEILAQKVAGRFADRERVYSVNQYRTGPGHADLGERLERTFPPRGPWRYEKPVVVLWGRVTLSSAESLALMFAQCPQVTTMGEASGGSSGNPRQLALSCGITVNLPRWLDMDPAGNPIEHVGVKPERLVAAKPEDFTAGRDPVLQAALKRLQ